MLLLFDHFYYGLWFSFLARAFNCWLQYFPFVYSSSFLYLSKSKPNPPLLPSLYYYLYSFWILQYTLVSFSDSPSISLGIGSILYFLFSFVLSIIRTQRKLVVWWIRTLRRQAPEELDPPILQHPEEIPSDPNVCSLPESTLWFYEFLYSFFFSSRVLVIRFPDVVLTTLVN